MGRVISTAIQFIDGFTKPSKEVIQSMRQMGNEAIKAGKQIQSAGKTISNVGSTLTTAITLPIAGVATAAVKTAADFESAMSEVGAIAGNVADDEISGIIQKAGEMGLSFKEGADATETAMNILKSKAQQMGATTAFSASESAEAMKYMAMAGWKTADMMDGIEGIMNLAAASGEELGTTADIVTDAITAFGMSAKDSTRFADVLAATSSSANTNVSMLGESFKYCASTAGAMGYSVEDISVALGVMANAGVKGSTAGTTLKNIIANLAKPTDAQAAVMDKLGISLTDNSGNMKSFAEVMENLRSSFSGLSETEKAAAATTLAGKESMSGLLTIVNTSSKDFNDLTEAINGSSGSAEEMARKMHDNLNGQLTLLKSAIEGIAITIGDKLLPYITKAVSWVQTVADYINNLSDAQINNIMKWAGIAAAIGPAIMVFGKIVTAVGTAQRMFGTITKTIANFGGIIGVITSPAGIVIGVLAAIAVAAVLIIKNWDQVKGFLQSVGNWFKNAFEKAGFSTEDFKNKFTSIGNTIGSIAGIFKKKFAGGISEGAAAAGRALKAIVGGVDLNKFSANISNIKTRVSSIINNLKTIFSVAFSVISSVIQKAMKIIVPVVKVAFSAMGGAISAKVNEIKAIISGLMTVLDGITTFISGVFTGNWSKAWEGVKTIFKGVFESLAALCKAPINAVIGIINGAIAGINKLNISIPDWVPGIGGQTFGINIPTIPMLYKGADNWKGGTAVINDRGGEIVDLPKGSRVYPHDKSVEMAKQEGTAKSGSVSINIQKLADKIEVRSDEDIDRIAEALAYKLKNVAFNTGTA